MSATPQNKDSQEIDLSQISKKIGDFFENLSTRIFKVFLFFKRNIIWIGVLFILGAGLGVYLDKTAKVYDNQLIVCPNFGSVDYLYSKVELINSKIEDKDTLFLKNVVGIKDPKDLKEITIVPIPDVYKFIENKDANFELIKLMAEDGDVKKVVNEKLTSKNYPFHMISFTTLGKTSEAESIVPLMKFFNDSDYYKMIQKQFLNNIKIKMTENDSTITQINGFLNAFKGSVNGSQKSDKLVYYNENSQLNDVIKTKDLLVYEQGTHRIELVNLDKVVKDNSYTLNVRNNKSVNGKMKLVLPLLFVGLFVLAGLMKSYYRNQMAKLNT